MNIEAKILEASHLPANLQKKPVSEINKQFHEIIDCLKLVHDKKGELYGSFVISKQNESEEYAFLETFFEMKRKFTRLKKLTDFVTFKKDQFSHSEKEALLDTFLDLAVYATMGVDLWFDRFGDDK